MKPRVYICVLNYNNYKDTLECINSLELLCYDNYCVLVIDNNSTDDSGIRLQEYVKNNKKIVFIKNKYNCGYAAGNNVGIKFAMKDIDMRYVWILNNDTIVDPYALNELVEIAEKNTSIGLVGSKLIYDWNRKKIQGYGGVYCKYTGVSRHIKDEKEINKMNYVIGASVLARREYLEDVGLMREDYFLYYEEVDWATRGMGKYSIACAKDSVVYHKEGGTVKRDKTGERMSCYFSVRNKLLITKRFYPQFFFLVSMRALITSIYRMACFDFYTAWIILKLIVGIKEDVFEKLNEANNL